MIETVQTLATKYGREKGDNNQSGTISILEAKNALRANRGNVWAAVTECIEHRRKKVVHSVILFNDSLTRILSFSLVIFFIYSSWSCSLEELFCLKIF